MAERVPTEEVQGSAAESRSLLRQIEEHHDAAEAAANRGDYETADTQNDRANALADQLQAKIGPNHTVNGDGTITFNQVAGDRFDLEQSFAADRLAENSDLSSEDVALAGGEAAQPALDVVAANQAEQVEEARQDYIEGLLESEGIDPSLATEDDVRNVVEKEELNQSGTLSRIEGAGSDPDSMTPRDLKAAAERAVSEREEELERDLNGGTNPTLDGQVGGDPAPPPDDGSFGGPRQGQAKPSEDDGNLTNLVSGDRPPVPPSGQETSTAGESSVSGSSGAGPEGDSGGSSGPTAVGGEEPSDPNDANGRLIDQLTGPTPDDPGPDPGGGSPDPPANVEPPGAGWEPVRTIDMSRPSSKTDDTGVSIRETVEGTVFENEQGEQIVVDPEGETHRLVGNPAESQPVEEGPTFENLHADDPIVAQMIEQEHDAKQNADIDYGDNEPVADTMTANEIPDQIDYGSGFTQPAVDADDLSVESPDGGVIDPSPEGEVTAGGEGRSDGDPIDDLAQAQQGSSSSEDTAFGDGSTEDDEQVEQPAAAGETPSPDPKGDQGRAEDPDGMAYSPPEPVFVQEDVPFAASDDFGTSDLEGNDTAIDDLDTLDA